MKAIFVNGPLNGKVEEIKEAPEILRAYRTHWNFVKMSTDLEEVQYLKTQTTGEDFVYWTDH